MHTFQGKNGTTFHYNGDCSGEVTVQLNKLQFKVNGEDLEAFARMLMRDKLISLIETNF